MCLNLPSYLQCSNSQNEASIIIYDPISLVTVAYDSNQSLRLGSKNLLPYQQLRQCLYQDRHDLNYVDYAEQVRTRCLQYQEGVAYLA